MDRPSDISKLNTSESIKLAIKQHFDYFLEKIVFDPEVLRWEPVVAQLILVLNYSDYLKAFSDPKEKAKEIKSMMQLCEGYPTVPFACRLKNSLSKKQYELSKII